ncbi:26443_t:CDS:1 [Gigaspora margarita]|uniref:26443_t:CDS:1 n=1 Tax=Gigaspora margarita TaxID=4874 RepID=A0ABM8W2C5_GIGMA|nr:26443_t:CDS:1 [Gigaspora margarita]
MTQRQGEGQVHSVLFDNGESYDYGSPETLQFYSTPYGYPNNAYIQQSSSYYAQQPYPAYNNGGNTGGFWSAFGTGGFPGEPPLLDGRIFTIHSVELCGKIK